MLLLAQFSATLFSSVNLLICSFTLPVFLLTVYGCAVLIYNALASLTQLTLSCLSAVCWPIEEHVVGEWARMSRLMRSV